MARIIAMFPAMLGPPSLIFFLDRITLSKIQGIPWGNFKINIFPLEIKSPGTHLVNLDYPLPGEIKKLPGKNRKSPGENWQKKNYQVKIENYQVNRR